jgi:hypothetical protein
MRDSITLRRGMFTCVLLLLLVVAAPAAAQNPFAIDGVIGDNGSGVPTPTKVNDPFGNSKELGPKNNNTTKVGVIHAAPTPMLDLTNPNGQVDLTTIYTQTTQAQNGDLWYYFGWIRDNESGSGFLSIEFQQNAVPAICVSSNYTDPGCNPWAGRKAGDFILLWDQQGSSTTIIKRTFTLVNGVLTLGAGVVVASASAQFSNDGFAGEAAVNLTQDVFPQGGVCVNFANIIPNTVTGNSDQADYKDSVLSPFPDVTNCGGLVITKKTIPSSLTGNFIYTLGAGGAAISPADAIDSDCTEAASTTTCVGKLEADGSSDTITGLFGGTGYVLTEQDPGPLFALKSIECVLGTTTFPGSAFTVAVGQTTVCTITNEVLKTTPGQTTVQAGQAQIFDQINITGIRPGAQNAASATVTFKLYSDNACSNQVGLVGPISLSYGGDNTTATANTMGSPLTITPGVVYYWLVTYSGDALNNGFTTACGQETASVTFTFVQ